MSSRRPELHRLESAIISVLRQHPDTSLASLAGRQMLVERLASELCPDAGVDVDNLQHFYEWLVDNPTQHLDTIQRDWLGGLIVAILGELATYGFSVLVPLGDE